MALDEIEGWSLLEVLGGSANDQAVNRLAREISALSAADQSAFAEFLHSRLRVLMQPPVLENMIAYLRKENGTVSDDQSLFLACAILAAGKVRYMEVMSDPQQIKTGGWDLGGADLLWGVVPEPASDRSAEPTPHRPWLSANISGSDVPMFRLRDAMLHVARRRVAESDRWLEWRARTGVDAITLHLDFNGASSELRVRLIHSLPRPEVDVDIPRSQLPGLSPRGWVDLLSAILGRLELE